MTNQTPPPVSHTRQLALYYKATCPFCVKVLDALQTFGIDGIERCNPLEEENLNTLISEGGKRQVPCLRIEAEGQVFWLYESDAIIAYLQRSFQ